MRQGGLVLLLAGGAIAGGCTMAARTTESALTQAGFRQLPADSPEKVSHLQTLPDRTIVKRNRDGKTYYVYADPEYCKCLYMGTQQQYAQYRGIVRSEDEAGIAE